MGIAPYPPWCANFTQYLGDNIMNKSTILGLNGQVPREAAQSMRNDLSNNLQLRVAKRGLRPSTSGPNLGYASDL